MANEYESHKAINIDAINQAQAFAKDGKVFEAWSVLGEAGDNYAANAANIIKPDSNSFTQALVKKTWEESVGIDAYNENFDAVAQSHVDGYLDVLNEGIIDDAFAPLPDTVQIEESYKNALNNNGLPTDVSVDALINTLGLMHWTTLLDIFDGNFDNQHDIDPSRISDEQGISATDPSSLEAFLDLVEIGFKAALDFYVVETVEELFELLDGLRDRLIGYMTDLFEWIDPIGIGESVNDYFNQARNWILRRDPMTLDLDGDGLETIGIDSSNPILFDHDGDGVANATGWISPDDGLLVFDRNANGISTTAPNYLATPPLFLMVQANK